MNPLLAAEVCEQLAALARSGSTEELLRVLGDASPNVVDMHDDSLLTLAAYHGHAETVRALLLRGADASFRNGRGLAPLEIAVFKGWDEVVMVLLELGVDVNDKGPDGRTALMWAAAFGRERAIQLLRSHGASLSAVDKAGYTAADHARSMGLSTLANVALEQVS